MSKKIAIFLLSILITTQLTGCALTDYFNKPEKIARFVSHDKVARAENLENSAEVEILDLQNPELTLYLSKSSTAEAKYFANISAETSGRVADIKTIVGTSVKGGETLMTLGNSLSTDMTNLQYQTAIKAFEIASNSQAITNDTSRRSILTSSLGVKTAYESYQNAIKTKNNSEDIYDEQRSGAKSGKNSAKDAREYLEDTIDSLKGTISDLENQKDNIEDTLNQLDPTDPTYQSLSDTLNELESGITEAKTQKNTLKASLESADNGVDQADNALDLLEVSYEAQQDQLEFAIFAAAQQYEIAIKQFEIAANAAELQNLGIQTQVLQLDSAAKIAALSNEQKYIKSPIKGIVTEIEATENNFISPGQVIAKVENPETLLLKTSVNTEELKFLTLNQEVKITQGSKEITGKITAISPSLNTYSKKIEIEITAKNTAQIALRSLVKIRIPIQTNQIFIPLNSLYNNTKGQFIKIIENDKIKYLKVEAGEIINNFIEIKSGIKGNEKVIITPNIILEENESVKATQ